MTGNCIHQGFKQKVTVDNFLELSDMNMQFLVGNKCAV